MFSPGKSMNIGIPEIDQDHEELDQLIKDIGRILISNASAVEIHKLFLEFIFVIRDHFAKEERVVEEYKLPGMEKHKAEHKNLLDQLVEAEKNILEENGAWRKSLMGLADILTQHIITFDFELKNHLNN